MNKFLENRSYSTYKLNNSLLKFYFSRKVCRLSNMTKIIDYLLICMLLVSVKCQTNNETTNTVSNSRVTKVVEMHSQNIRQFLCRGNPITAEEWSQMKSECINPRISELIPENAIKAWQQCSEKLTDLCDDQQWDDSKTCAKDMLANENVTEMQMWYKYRIRQLTTNFQSIKSCYRSQRKTA